MWCWPHEFLIRTPLSKAYFNKQCQTFVVLRPSAGSQEEPILGLRKPEPDHLQKCCHLSLHCQAQGEGPQVTVSVSVSTYCNFRWEGVEMERYADEVSTKKLNSFDLDVTFFTLKCIAPRLGITCAFPNLIT